jgi:hypothetical protein
MAQDPEWTIWLTPGAGETLLGLPASHQHSNTRFRVLGKFKAEAFGLGIWFEVDRIEQLTLQHPFHSVNAWKIEPPTCLIRFDSIAYIQEGKSQSPTQVGFAPNP